MATIDQATELVRDVLATHGRGTLECECGAQDTYIDQDASTDDYLRVASLMSHAQYDHVTPRNVLFVAPIIVWEA